MKLYTGWDARTLFKSFSVFLDLTRLLHLHFCNLCVIISRKCYQTSNKLQLTCVINSIVNTIPAPSRHQPYISALHTLSPYTSLPNCFSPFFMGETLDL